jgi:energy-coupling factor transport system permease protein
MTTSVAPKIRTTARWRVVDIVVASVLAVAGGLVFVVWNLGYNAVTAPLEALLPGLQALFHGIWLFPGVLVALVVRKPGAAVFAEIVAASVSAFVGNEWGPATLLSGLVQGLGAEIVFAVLLYRAWRLVPAILAGAGAGVGMVLLDLLYWYAGTVSTEFATVYAICGIVSGALIAGLGSALLARALARTGALERFAIGREARARAEA